MIVTELSTEAFDEVQKNTESVMRATVEYMCRLSQIADISTLSLGIHDYDYAVTVPQDEKPRILPLLADLTFAIEDEFGVQITTLAVAGPPR